MAIGGMIVGKSFVTLMVNDATRTITEGQPNYHEIREAIKAKDMALVEKLINVADTVQQYMADKITIRHGQVFYGGEEIKGAVVDRIIDMMAEGFDHEPMVKFLENLMQNPSKRAVDELYGFLEDTALPITEEGHFLAYKKVREDYKDFYTGTMDNSVGQILEMPRNRVDEDKDRTCSAGLHFCSLSYLRHYQGDRGRVVIVKINPCDVVAIPSDYNNAKGRACRYEVIGEHTSQVEEAFKGPVYYEKSNDSNWSDSEDDSWDDDDFENEDHDEEESDWTWDSDSAYDEGWDRGNSQYTCNDSGGTVSFNNVPPDDVPEKFHEDYKRGYDDGWFAAKQENQQHQKDPAHKVAVTSPTSDNSNSAGYNLGRKDALAGVAFNDNPAAHAMVVEDIHSYKRNYARGWDSVKQG